MKKWLKIVVCGLALLKSDFCEAKLFNATEFGLDNGLRVVVIPNHKAPIVKHMLWYKVGSADEELGKGGTAHLLEHLMFRGTKRVEGSLFNQIMENNGIVSNAFTSYDYTAYHQEMDISKLELAMFLEADRMKNLRISDADFDLERDIVFQERKQVVENNPLAVFYENMRKVLWQDYAYARPVSGTPNEIKSLKIEDVRNFYEKYYVPQNAFLVLSGDIDVKTARRLAQKYYGDIEKGKGIARKDQENLKDDFSAQFEMKLPAVKSLRMSQNWLVSSINENYGDDVYALMILSKYLGEGKTSKLYKELVQNQKLALAVETSYDYLLSGKGTFSISLLPREGLDAKEVDEALQKALEKAVAAISLDEIENTKRKMLSGMVYLKDNPNSAAEIVGTMLASGMKLDEIESWAENIEKVNYRQVLNAGKQLLKRKVRLKARVIPLKENENHV